MIVEKIKVAVIGAGISGLAFAKYAQVNRHDDIKVKVFEASETYGGIAKVKDINGKIPYHMIGGHCFNLKFAHVKDFVFDNILPEKDWNKINRHASILFKGHQINYPIEYSVKQIFDFDPKLALEIVKDYYCASKEPASNLAQWFENNFGKTLAREYFIPYNRKIWGEEPSNMSADWVTDKLPLPNDMEILKGLIKTGSDDMPHSSFYYPKSGTQNTFIDALAKDIKVHYGCQISKIEKNKHGKYLVQDEEFDYVIYTGPLDKIDSLIEISNQEVRSAISKLRFNKVTTMLWRSKPTKDTWTYIPGNECIFHRMIHIGNFINSSQNYTITETVGEVSFDEMKSNGKEIELLEEPIDYNVSERAYVVFDENISEAKQKIFNYFSNERIELLGRFGEWEYYNMDVCIKRAIETVNSI
jgi:protoporphyrinogen oxidase